MIGGEADVWRARKRVPTGAHQRAFQSGGPKGVLGRVTRPPNARISHNCVGFVNGPTKTRPSDQPIMSPCKSGPVKLRRPDHKTQPSCSPSHTRVECDETAVKESRQCHVVGVIGLGPAHLSSYIPGFFGKPIRLVAFHGSRKYTILHRLILPMAHLTAPEHGVHPHQRRRDQFEPAKPLEPDGIRRRCDRDACVDDELQRPWRESATAATQFGAGEPSSSVRHSGGSGSIGYISSRTSSSAPGSINRLPWLVVAGKRPSRTQRRTVPGLLPTLCAASVTVSMTRCYALHPTGS